MSRTIITNSGSEFFTNINSEMLIGELCKIVGAKFFMFKFGMMEEVKMAYSMTEKETIDACDKLKTLYNRLDEIYPKLCHYFDKDCNTNHLKEFLDYYIECLMNSKGYECI